MADNVRYGSLPFSQQIRFFRGKANLPTRAWTDIYTREHDYAFVVAGANRDAIVADFRTAVDRAISEGRSLADFRKDFDRIVREHGWDYKGGRNWRSRVIYETNLRTSYAAGRYEQLQEVKRRRPFWRYRHSDAVQHPRPHHVAWDGLIIHADDPWWKTHYPPNGWGCQCYVEALAERDLRRLGKDGPDKAPASPEVEHVIGTRSPGGPRTVRTPEGIDPGFEYPPGASRYASAQPPEQPAPGAPRNSTGGAGLPNTRPLDELPPPRRAPASRLLPKGLSDDEYVSRYLDEFGATAESPVVFKDVVGEALVIGRELFSGRSGKPKVQKRGREVFVLLLADALREPDEVWVRLEWNESQRRAMVRRRYVARFQVAGQDAPMLAVFERGLDGWWGITTFQGQPGTEDDWRIGVRLYRRRDE
jgi:hypothetical protein